MIKCPDCEERLNMCVCIFEETRRPEEIEAEKQYAEDYFAMEERRMIQEWEALSPYNVWESMCHLEDRG